MRFIKSLSKDTIKMLERIYKHSKYHQVRQRAQYIKLSNDGYTISDLTRVFNVSRLTISNWFDDWDMFMLCGLYDKKGRGRKPKLNDEQKNQVKKWAKENPQNLQRVRNNIREEWGIDVSKETIKRVLDFLNRRNDLEVYLFECSINSDVVVACIDKFCEKLEKPTVLVIDNSSIHTSNMMLDKQKEWSEKSLTLFFLPTYSPELNIIEILWRFLIYNWLGIDAYESWESLVKAVEYTALS